MIIPLKINFMRDTTILSRELFFLILLLNLGLGEVAHAQKNVQLKVYSPCTKTDVEIPKEPNKSTFELFPNPNSGAFVLGITSEKVSEKVELQLFNAIGILVYRKEFKPTSLHYNEAINVENLPSGIYLIHLFDGENLFNEKVIINK